MLTIKYCFQLLLIISLIFIVGCRFLPKTVKVEVPEGYYGWCFIIPTNDIAKTSVKKNSKYQVNEYGVVYYPALGVDSSDLIIRVFESGIDISDFTRYSARVNQVKSNQGVKSRYQFIRFFLPAQDQRIVPENEHYWFDKGYEYRDQADKIFDSLLVNGKLLFR